MLRYIIITLIILCSCATAFAGSDSTSAVGSTTTTSSAGEIAAKPLDHKPAPEKSGVTVEVFSTSWCPYCRSAEQYLKKNGVRYVAHDIEKDRAAYKRYRKLGGRGVPLILVGSKKMYGFSPAALQQSLEHEQLAATRTASR